MLSSIGEYWNHQETPALFKVENEYQLDDGKILRIKMVVTRIIRLEGEMAPDGNPVYLIQSQNVGAPLG